jgi:hypothetical protein
MRRRHARQIGDLLGVRQVSGQVVGDRGYLL